MEDESTKIVQKQHSETLNIAIPEIGFVIVAIGLSTIAIASGSASSYVPLKVLSLIIYILAMWGGFIFYWHILWEKIPDTMAKWLSKKKGYFSIKAPFWIIAHWFRLVFYSGLVLTNNKRDDSLEGGYLTILLALFLYWSAGIFLYLVSFIELLTDMT